MEVYRPNVPFYDADLCSPQLARRVYAKLPADRDGLPSKGVCRKQQGRLQVGIRQADSRFRNRSRNLVVYFLGKIIIYARVGSFFMNLYFYRG